MMKQLDVCIIRLEDLKLSSPPEVCNVSCFDDKILMVTTTEQTMHRSSGKVLLLSFIKQSTAEYKVLDSSYK